LLWRRIFRRGRLFRRRLVALRRLVTSPWLLRRRLIALRRLVAPWLSLRLLHHVRLRGRVSVWVGRRIAIIRISIVRITIIAAAWIIGAGIRVIGTAGDDGGGHSERQQASNPSHLALSFSRPALRI
jgi:hypothetical protein